MNLIFKLLGAILLLGLTIICLNTNNKKNNPAKLKSNIEALCTGETYFDPEKDCQPANTICIKIKQGGEVIKYYGVRTFTE